MGKTDRAWERLGEIDPYYSVLSHPRFRAAANEGETRREFFASGEAHVEQLFAVIRENLDPAFAPRRALDFGCGVGRLTIPLARRVEQVTGMDVSDAMLTETTKNCHAAGVQNITLAKSNDRFDNVSGEFDFLHSFIVFQHIPVRRGEMIFGEMLRRLAENGVGALHFTYAIHASSWRKFLYNLSVTIPAAYRILNLAKGRSFSYPNVEMNSYNVNRLILRLQNHGCHRVHLRFSDHDGHRGVVLFFKKESLPLI
jgi:SAM-dependent methyltransferase